MLNPVLFFSFLSLLSYKTLTFCRRSMTLDINLDTLHKPYNSERHRLRQGVDAGKGILFYGAQLPACLQEFCKMFFWGKSWEQAFSHFRKVLDFLNPLWYVCHKSMQRQEKNIKHRSHLPPKIRNTLSKLHLLIEKNEFIRGSFYYLRNTCGKKIANAQKGNYIPHSISRRHPIGK